MELDSLAEAVESGRTKSGVLTLAVVVGVESSFTVFSCVVVKPPELQLGNSFDAEQKPTILESSKLCEASSDDLTSLSQSDGPGDTLLNLCLTAGKNFTAGTHDRGELDLPELLTKGCFFPTS